MTTTTVTLSTDGWGLSILKRILVRGCFKDVQITTAKENQ